MASPSTVTNHDTNMMKISKVASESYRCKIDFSRIEKIEKIDIGEYITSPAFPAGGHEWSITCYPLESNESANDVYLSLYLDLRSDTKDVSVLFDFNLLDKDSRPSATRSNRLSHVFDKSGDTWGWPKFIRLEDLKDSYVVDDNFVIVCTITVLSAPACPVVVPASDLHLHFGTLLEDKETADVTFNVRDKFFHAHRLVLATRSQVFKGMFYGMMKEHNLTDINIDMEPLVFRSLIHFIYTDSLPDDDDDDSSLIRNDILMIQHLLVVARQYLLDRLKLMCEAKLYKTVTVDTVATTLAIAEQNNCCLLKKVCIEFAAVQENYNKIKSTEEYLHLNQDYPIITKEIQHRYERN